MGLIVTGMTARLADGVTLPVRGVLLDPATHSRLGVVLGAHGLFGPDVVAPASSIWLIDDAVHLSLTCSDLSALPVFHRWAPAAGHEPAAGSTGHYICRHRPRTFPHAH